MSEALNENGHEVLFLSIILVQQMINIQEIVDEVRTPAKHERWNHNIPSLTYLTLWRSLLPYMDTVIKYLVSDRVKPSFVIFDIGALWRSVLSVRMPGCQKLQMAS